MRVYFLPSSIFAISVGCVLTFLSPSLHAFTDEDARRAIQELRQQSQKVAEQNQRNALHFAEQIQSIQQEMAQLRDKIERLAHEPIKAKLPMISPAVVASTTTTIVETHEQTAYEGALDMFRQAQYKQAAEALTGFLLLYPNSSMASLAQFYLGSSRYALKDFKGAIEQLERLVSTFPNHARAPDALLIVAGCQVELNHPLEAKITLHRIVRDYPVHAAAATAKHRLQLLP